MVSNNAINLSAAGIVKYDGIKTFTGLTTTNHNIILGNASNSFNFIAPASNVGVPLISNGLSSDPLFGTATVVGGGTGLTAATPYAILCGGITNTSQFQSIASVGTSGQVLTSNGAGALPTFQSNAGGSIVKLSTQTASASASIAFDSTLITATYNTYMLVINNVIPSATTNTFEMQVSTDNGSTYKNTGYNAQSSSFQGSGAGVSSSNSTTNFLLTNTSLFGTTNAWNGTIYLYNMTSGNTPSISGSSTFFQTTAASQVVSLAGGWGPASITVNNIKFFLASGTFTTGTFTLYGIAQ